MKGLTELKLLGQGLISQPPSLQPHEAVWFALQCIKVEMLNLSPAGSTFQNWGENCIAAVGELMCQCMPLPPYLLRYLFPASFQRIPGPAAPAVTLSNG